MDQQTPIPATNANQAVNTDAVLFRAASSADLEVFAAEPAPLHHIGFTGILTPGGSSDTSGDTLNVLAESGLSVLDEDAGESALRLSSTRSSAVEIWTSLESEPVFTDGADLSVDTATDRHQGEAITLLQMAVKPVPIVPVTSNLVYSGALREQRELLRSLVFWRKRFDIARHQPKLVHAGEDGLLIFIVDSWLVTVNQNADEAAIDLGSYGSMWLMLGTQRDVHLHGSMLVLPPYSGAIVANELAR